MYIPTPQVLLADPSGPVPLPAPGAGLVLPGETARQAAERLCGDFEARFGLHCLSETGTVELSSVRAVV